MLKMSNYDTILRHTISDKDILPLDTSIREIIKGFADDKKTFYFLAYHSLITGIITLGNLNCRQVQVYIFALICELELGLTDFIENNLNDEQLEDFMDKKSVTNKKLKEIWEKYQKLSKSGLENKLLEHLYLIDFFTIIEHFDLITKFEYSKSKWKELTSINDLRHSIAHPTRSLVDKKNDVNQLWRRIGRIEDLSFRLNQLKQTQIS